MKVFKRSVEDSVSAEPSQKANLICSLNSSLLKPILFTLAIVLIVTAVCAGAPKVNKLRNSSKFINFSAIRSYMDKKKYHLYTHTSKLNVLIIEDPSVSISSAAMSVNSGNNKEGKDIYGLAHFCEHMLFLGSKKYPNPTHFVDYISKNGGRFNGYTDFETTAFFYKISSRRFKHSLDIFSRFFIDPLFSAEYVKKEVNSVNSEFERNIQMDTKRKEMVLRAVAHKDSLFHRFSTGNTETLWGYAQKNKIDLRQRVVEYHKAHYRPDNMKMVIYGNKSIKHYKRLVEKYFKEMKAPGDKYDPDKLGKWEEKPWKENKLGKLVLYKTINEHQNLDISIYLDDIFTTLPHNPSLYFKVLLNYRGRGSIDDLLRRRGYVASLKSFLRKTHSGFSLFILRGYITHRGIKNLNHVLKLIYNYIRHIRQKALDKNLYSYVKKAFDLAFFFVNRKKRVFTFMKEMTSNVWKYGKKFIFSQHKIMGPYNKQVLEKFGNRLQLKNSIIMLGNNNFRQEHVSGYRKFVDKFPSDKRVLQKEEEFIKVKYDEFQLDQEFISSVDEGKAAPMPPFRKNMQLFTRKKSLPKKVSLVKTCDAENRLEVEYFFKLVPE